MTDYNLLFSTDKNYLPYMFVLTQSILDNIEDTNTNSEDRLVFHVLLDKNVQDQVFLSYTQAFHEINQNSKIAFKFEPHKINDSTFQGFNAMNHLGNTTLSIYYRLLVSHAIPQDISRILYLDIDILVRADIRNLFKQYPMQKEVMYAGITPGAFFRSKRPFVAQPYLELQPRDPNNTKETYKIPLKDCICSGLLLINLEQWREQHIEEQCLNFGAKWYTPLYDQDILSAVCRGKVSFLSWDWHVHSNILKLNTYGGYDLQTKFAPIETVLSLYENAPSVNQLKQICLNPKIVHFTHQKPWNTTEAVILEHFHQIKDHLIFIKQWIQVFIKISPELNKVKANLS